jgi:hypothetical protein
MKMIFTQFWLGDLEIRDQFESLGVDGILEEEKYKSEG